ncbi:hypothetical protein HBA54_27360 [Pelagibius litoralis]|uniref:Uncharacterized protein n=1 Tax=Pelagibius litoralis TaxID=374515 RepID=A0A967KF96_9PROT|nr:hypothetical protein [Pelagibius litoralis]NIA72314.1 hypothetical protein [Pelagibius litoralis]
MAEKAKPSIEKKTCGLSQSASEETDDLGIEELPAFDLALMQTCGDGDSDPGW